MQLGVEERLLEHGGESLMLLGFGRGSPTIFEGTKEQPPVSRNTHICLSCFKSCQQGITDP